MVLHLCIIDVDITRIERLRKKFTGDVVYEVVAHRCNRIYFRMTRTFESCLLRLTIIIQPAIRRTISKKSNMEIAPKSSEHEKRVYEINDDHNEYDFLHKKIGAKPYDCIDSARNRSSS